VTPEKDAEQYLIKILDVAQAWPHGGYPLIPTGRLVLDRSPSNFFAEVGQAGFSPRECLLESSLHSAKCCKADFTATTILSAIDWAETLIRCQLTARSEHRKLRERDGFMRVNGNYGANGNYEPDSVMPFTFSEKARSPACPREVTPADSSLRIEMMTSHRKAFCIRH